MRYYYLKRDEPIWAGPMSRDQLAEAFDRNLLNNSSWVQWDNSPIGPIKYESIDCLYFVAHRDIAAGLPPTAYRTIEDMLAAVDRREIDMNSMVCKRAENAKPIPVTSYVRPPLKFDPAPWAFLDSRQSKNVTVIAGPNNCGKSFLLKSLQIELGQKGYLTLASRFHQGQFSRANPLSEQEKQQLYNSFVQQQLTANNNFDQVNNPQRVFQALDDEQRQLLASTVGEMLGVEVDLTQGAKQDTFTIDGDPIEITSSGVRLLMSLLATCMVSDYDVILIDEPEIGLNPRLQNALAFAIVDPRKRASLFGAVRRFIVCTHSHVFLDRSEIQNNFWLERNKKDVSIRQIQSMSEWHALQLKMLGNDLRSMFLPEAIVLVEGPSEQAFLEGCFAVTFPNHRVAVLDCKTETDMPKRLDDLKAAFGGIEQSPYTNRIFCVLDSKHQTHTGELRTRGVAQNHIVIWDHNGIEFVYPDRILSAVFSTSDRTLLQMDRNHVACNGVKKKKTELAGIVARQLKSDESWPDELETKLLEPLRKVLA
ncbi:MAG: AAA family ATPase [Planctomycetaceae bacterium]|nr:AAA family ATPase [Planctomycetaceae bacterium]